MTRLPVSVLIAAFGLLPGRLSAATFTEVHYVMGTYFRIVAEGYEQPTRAAMRECFVLARQDDQRFSRFDSASELSRLNAGASESGPVVVSADMAELLRRALDLRSATGGAFDVTIGALTQLWRTTGEWPSGLSIRAAQSADATRSLDVTGTTFSRSPGVQLDFDGIAKGWTVDRCAVRLRSAGVERAFLSFGESSVLAIGAPHGASGWEVTLRGLDENTAIGVLTLHDQALSVSSVFGHAHRVGLRRVGHIVDPRSGQALAVPATAVVVAPSATDAEAWSKALLVDASRGNRTAGSASVALDGTLLITRSGMRRTGRIAFRSFKAPRPIAVAAEALR
jgi:thiamine biosynthesis lipoprotein